MDYLFQDGGKPKKTKSKTSTKTGTKTTKSKTTSKKSSSKKGGNFLGTVGELVAPTGWETFATTAGLFALDRADSALRRGKSEKSSSKKGGSKMRGGTTEADVDALLSTDADFLNKLKQNWSTAYSERVIDRHDTPFYVEKIEEEIDREILKRKQLLDIVINEHKRYDSIKNKLSRSISRLEQESQKNSKRLYRETKIYQNLNNERKARLRGTNETRGIFNS
jgi:hypothetical protein